MTQFHGTLKAEAPLTEEQKKARRKDISAFPVNKYEGSWVDGMNLRDYFAAKAMQGFMSTLRRHAIDEGYVVTPQQYAEWAYEMADAMIEMRTE